MRYLHRIEGVDMGKLDGKVAIVTGGARGVGLGHAKLLAAEGDADAGQQALQHGRWSLDELDAKAAELFGDRSTKPRRMMAAEQMPTNT